MNLTFFLFTYLVVWCVSLFAVLPFGVQPTGGNNPLHYAAAPLKAGLKRKLLWNSLLALAITLFIHFLLLSGIVPLREEV